VAAERALAIADGHGDVFGFAIFFRGDDFDGVGAEWGGSGLCVFFAHGDERVRFGGDV